MSLSSTIITGQDAVITVLTREYFPDPKAMIDELHEMGIETMVSIWPQIDWRSENYEEMKQQGLLVKSNAGVDVQMLFHGNNVFLDATNPRTRKYVWEKVKKNLCRSRHPHLLAR